MIVGKKIKLTPTEWAYLAGIVDGEGFISFVPRGVSKHGMIRMRAPCVGGSSTNKELIDWVKTRAAGTAAKWDHGMTNSKLTYNWRVTHLRAVQLIAGCLPYLVIKRKQAELLLRHQQIRSHARSNGGMVRTKEFWITYSPDVVAELNTIHNAMFDLNARGKAGKSLAKRVLCGTRVEV